MHFFSIFLILINFIMFCPSCRSRALLIEKGVKKCLARSCLYISFSPIQEILPPSSQQVYLQTPDDHTRQYYQKLYDLGVSAINLYSEHIELPKNACLFSHKYLDQFLAFQMRKQIVDIKYGNGDRAKIREINNSTIKRYSLFFNWLGSYRYSPEKYDSQESSFAVFAGMNKSQWQKMGRKCQHNKKSWKFYCHKELSLPLPKFNIERYIKRVCVYHKIDEIQMKAMFQLAQNLRKYQFLDDKPRQNVAAFIFFHIMRRSYTYNNQHRKFEMQNFLSQQQIQIKGLGEDMFDCKFNSIISYIKLFPEGSFEKLIPYFPSKM